MLTKDHLVKAMVFPIVMYGYESWTIKKTEHQRIDVFELWCWRIFLRVPWTARSSQSILKEIRVFIGRTDAEVEAPILWPPNVKSQLTGRDPEAGEIDGKRRRGWERMGWLISITKPMDMTKLQETVKDKEAWRAAVHQVAKSRTQVSHWTTILPKQKDHSGKYLLQNEFILQ